MINVDQLPRGMKEPTPYESLRVEEQVVKSVRLHESGAKTYRGLRNLEPFSSRQVSTGLERHYSMLIPREQMIKGKVHPQSQYLRVKMHTFRERNLDVCLRRTPFHNNNGRQRIVVLSQILHHLWLGRTFGEGRSPLPLSF